MELVDAFTRVVGPARGEIRPQPRSVDTIRSEIGDPPQAETQMPRLRDRCGRTASWGGQCVL